jgi:hypothetical protein
MPGGGTQTRTQTRTARIVTVQTTVIASSSVDRFVNNQFGLAESNFACSDGSDIVVPDKATAQRWLPILVQNPDDRVGVT